MAVALHIALWCALIFWEEHAFQTALDNFSAMIPQFAALSSNIPLTSPAELLRKSSDDTNRGESELTLPVRLSGILV